MLPCSYQVTSQENVVEQCVDNKLLVERDNQGKIDVTSTNSITKAVMDGSKCLRHVIVSNIKDKCIDLKNCIRQQSTPMGFLPITNLKRLNIASSLKPNVIVQDRDFDPVAVHKVVRATGKFNFEGAKVQLPSKINFPLLEYLAKDYWDYQLPYFLKFGFPLDFNPVNDKNLVSAEENHSSATKFPEHVKKYIEIEKEHKAIFGPFTLPPYGESTHVSPFMSRDKPDSENRRIIIDLSWPAEASVNYFTKGNFYLGTVYKLQYPTVDNITESLLRLGSEAVIYKIDLSRAFRQLRIDPCDYHLLTLKWGSHFFADTFCPFGHRSGSMMCSRLSDFFRYIMFNHGFVVYTYVDDILGIGTEPKASEGFQFLLQTLNDLGFPISKSKLVAPTTRCNCLGIMVDAKERTLSIPHHKLKEILSKCERVSQSHVITVKQLQSVIGSLMFIYKCVKPSRYFVNRLLENLRSANATKIVVNEDIRKDIAWFIKFLPVFNNSTTYDHKDIAWAQSLAIDACLQGVGGVWDENVYTCVLPEVMRQDDTLNITHFEMVNIIIALKLWGQQWANKKVLLKTDNMAVAHICTNGYTRDMVLATYVRNMWLLTAKYDIELVVQHVEGKNNVIADVLSRWNGSESNYKVLNIHVKNPKWHRVQEEWFQMDYCI